MPNLELNFNGATLPADITQQLINFSENKLNVPPSYLITKLHYEGLWGTSAIGQADNNWGGMTWVNSWSDPYKRKSGVTVTKGSPRPANEGGNYIRYASVQDFLTDWSHLIRIGGIYNVGNSETFREAVKGMFVYGGAQCDYAIMNIAGAGCNANVANSKRRFELYYERMVARRNAINNANNGVLDELDNGNFSTDEPVDVGNEPTDTVGNTYESTLDKIKESLGEFEQEVYEVIENLFSSIIYDFNQSRTKANSLLAVEKIFNNSYKVKMTTNIKEAFKKVYDKTDGDVGTESYEKDDKTEPNDNATPDQEGDTGNKPFFPHEKPYRVTSTYGYRVNPVTGQKGEFHAGDDYTMTTPGVSGKVFAVQDAEVVVGAENGMSQSAGWMVYLKHTSGDNYFSRYLHLREAPPVSKGDTVKKGEFIGMSGATGYVTGVHLHFEVAPSYNDLGTPNAFNPRKYLQVRYP